ncbi:hypothetical protein HPP92_021220 [Vanilla planifolia]|uniref:Uncharacterized protein n=1 Tax=Vanilla planifolia TaxID=51239 RepID=A0A835UH87_VANPL|nr:hypothetical protein HPP92_021585 [Vanilla planifolia]KAG0462744.1 hypothetical protein HPP92_021220 [Vanilla planifolia]
MKDQFSVNGIISIQVDEKYAQVSSSLELSSTIKAQHRVFSLHKQVLICDEVMVVQELAVLHPQLAQPVLPVLPNACFLPDLPPADSWFKSILFLFFWIHQCLKLPPSEPDLLSRQDDSS